MRSRRLPGQREAGRPAPGSPPPPSAANPAPLPAETYFDERNREAFPPAPAQSEGELFSPPPLQLPVLPSAPVAGSPREVADSFDNFANAYGVRGLLAGILLAQIAIFMLILPRMVNAAETLLFRPGHLLTLAALGALETGLWLWAMWTRSWLGTVTCGVIAVAWWFYLLAQII